MALNYTVYAANERPPEETRDIYTKWATNYDKDMEENGLTGAKSVVDVFSKLNLDKNLHILDFGAGTGAIGVSLKKLGYQNVDGLDGCQEMLDVSESKNAYQKYIQALFKKEIPLPIGNNTYDVVIMAGVISPGHLGPDCFEELIRIVKSGGIVCWAMRDPKLYSDKADIFKDDNFDKEVDKLCQRNLWKFYQPGPILIPDYNVNMAGYAYVMQVL